jgi:hypothetical protein
MQQEAFWLACFSDPQAHSLLTLEHCHGGLNSLTKSKPEIPTKLWPVFLRMPQCDMGGHACKGRALLLEVSA